MPRLAVPASSRSRKIVQKLEQQFMLAPQGKIRADVVSFLEQLHAKRIIDY